MSSNKSNWVFPVSLVVAWTLITVPAVAQKQAPGPPPPPTQNVLVVNGSGQPVPTAPQGTTNVAGTVNVGNTPSVTVANTPSVTVANTPSVSISGTPTVALSPGGSTGVTNPLDGSSNAIPLAITEGAQFLVETCSGNFNGNGSVGCSFPAVPSGQLLVVQEFDVQVSLDTGVKPQALYFGDGITNHYFSDTFMATFQTVDLYATHQPTHMYVFSGTIPTCGLLSNSNGSVNGYVNCQLSGFLIDHP